MQSLMGECTPVTNAMLRVAPPLPPTRPMAPYSILILNSLEIRSGSNICYTLPLHLYRTNGGTVILLNLMDTICIKSFYYP